MSWSRHEQISCTLQLQVFMIFSDAKRQAVPSWKYSQKHKRHRTNLQCAKKLLSEHHSRLRSLTWAIRVKKLLFCDPHKHSELDFSWSSRAARYTRKHGQTMPNPNIAGSKKVRSCQIHLATTSYHKLPQAKVELSLHPKDGDVDVFSTCSRGNRRGAWQRFKITRQSHSKAIQASKH